MSHPRQVAADIIGRWLRTGTFPDRMLDRVSQDHGPVMELVHGVVRWHRALNWFQQQLTHRPPHVHLESFLLVGLYQIFFTEVPPHAVVHETVEAAKSTGHPASAKFVNAILRRALREKESLQQELEKQPPGIRWSHPDILIQRWSTRWPEAELQKLCAFHNTPPVVVINLLLSRTSLNDYQDNLRASGIEVQPHPFAPHRSLIIPRAVKITGLPGYTDGCFFVQDPSGLVAVELLDPRPGENILDACAAPGGKALLIADGMKDQGQLTAVDAQADRLRRLRENVARTRFQSIRILQADARKSGAIPDTYDGILLDVPCTNTGVLRRRPDARWRFTPDRLKPLVETQRAILDSCSRQLKPGGRLVYSTCSLEPEENEEQIQSWLQTASGFRLLQEKKLFPPESNTDGAYAALLQKT